MIRAETVSTDKVRFVDMSVPRERHVAPFVHSVEVSDHRSIANFVTMFTKGPCPEQAAWQQWVEDSNPGVDMHKHAPEIFHRDNGSISWVWDVYFPRSQTDSGRWHKHFHWPLDKAPTHKSVAHVMEALGDGISADLARAVVSYFQTDMKEAA